MSVQKLRETELCLVLPASLATGEPGDPIGEELQRLIMALALRKYWPYDFGESSDNAIELWFELSTSVTDAITNAARFIVKGGDI